MDNVLITGASGFLGGYLVDNWPKAQLHTLSRKPIKGATHWPVDITKPFELPTKFDLVIHAAGKAHQVPNSERQIQEMFAVNEAGTRNLLKALSNTGVPSYFVLISTVAVYGLQSGSLISEEMPAQAQDPYGLSKLKAEQMVTDWGGQQGVKTLILRLPLVYGAHPPGNLQKMIKAIRAGRWLHIRGGAARRSMVLAEDVAQLIPSVVGREGIYNLTDGIHPTYRALYDQIAQFYGKKRAFNLPLPLAKILAKVGNWMGPKAPFNSNVLEKLTSDLTFSDEKARSELNWNPSSVLQRMPDLLNKPL